MAEEPRSPELAELSLKMLANGELEQVKGFVFGATFDVRQIVDEKVFEQGKDSEFDSASKATGFVKTHYEENRPNFSLYHSQVTTKEEALLMSMVLTNVAALVFSSIGLDVSPTRQDELSKK